MSLGLRQTPLSCAGHTRPVVDLAFSAVTDCGYFLIAASKDGKPMLRQGDTGDWIGTFEGHKGAVWGATLNREATLAATAAADFDARIWDALTGQELHSLTHPHIVKRVCFSTDSTRLLTGCNDKKLRLYDVEAPDAPLITMEGHGGGVQALLFLPEEQAVLSAADDKTLRVWDLRTGEETRCVQLHAPCTSVELSADGTLLTATCADKVTFWSVGECRQTLEYTMPCPVYSASLHPDKSVFVAAGEDFIMYKHDFTTGMELEASKGHFGPVHATRFSPDGELFASGSEDGTLRLWQTTVGKTYGLWKYVVPDPDAGDAEA